MLLFDVFHEKNRTLMPLRCGGNNFIPWCFIGLYYIFRKYNLNIFLTSYIIDFPRILSLISQSLKANSIEEYLLKLKSRHFSSKLI